MKILLLADQAEPTLWEHLDRRKLEGVELVLACGDLPASYLSFLTCFTAAPILYVRGNHDDRYDKNPPEGCDSIEDTLVTVNGMRILGLGGSQMYSRGPHQYTERQMQRRIQRLTLKIRRAGGVDIVLAHAPVRGYGDEDNITHRGFEAFIPLLDKYRPRYFIHGHVHKSYSAGTFERIRRYGDTLLINASERYILDTDEL